jgi:hypothetical protein
MSRQMGILNGTMPDLVPFVDGEAETATEHLICGHPMVVFKLAPLNS